MDESLYHLHYQQEESHWWFAARAEIVRAIVERYGNLSPGDSILDIGCGTGAILKSFADRYNVIGLDMSPLAVEYSKKRGLKNVFQMSAEEFPRDQYKVRAAFLLDVIEHIDNDLEVLRAAREIVSPDGRVIITVPAYMWMWSAHDVMNHHKRRYTAATLRSVLDKAGLEPIKLTYYNTLLFPLAAVKKKLLENRDTNEAHEALDQPSALVNTVFKSLFAFEKHLVPSLNFPFGVSLLAVARPKVSA